MTPITRDEIEELERKAKDAGEMTPCVVIQSDPDDFGETEDWFIWFNKAGFYGGKADTSMMDEPTARYIAAALESVPRLIARIRELESACVGMADRLEEYCGELVADGQTKEAANVRRILVTLREAAKGRPQ